MPILFSSSWETRTFFILPLFSSRLSFFRPSTFEFFEKERSNNNYGRRLSLRYYSWRGSKGVVEGNQLVREFIKINHGSETMVTSSSYRKQYTTDRTVVTDLEALNLVNAVHKKKGVRSLSSLFQFFWKSGFWSWMHAVPFDPLKSQASVRFWERGP